MTPAADRWIRWTTTGCVAPLALIAGTVSYLHMHLLVELYGQPGWVAALTPLSVDGMIVAASTSMQAITTQVLGVPPLITNGRSHPQTSQMLPTLRDHRENSLHGEKA